MVEQGVALRVSRRARRPPHLRGSAPGVVVRATTRLRSAPGSPGPMASAIESRPCKRICWAMPRWMSRIQSGRRRSAAYILQQVAPAAMCPTPAAASDAADADQRQLPADGCSSRSTSSARAATGAPETPPAPIFHDRRRPQACAKWSCSWQRCRPGPTPRRVGDGEDVRRTGPARSSLAPRRRPPARPRESAPFHRRRSQTRVGGDVDHDVSARSPSARADWR